MTTVLFLVFPLGAQASKILSGTLGSVTDEYVYIKYRSPAGDKYARCEREDLDCDKISSSVFSSGGNEIAKGYVASNGEYAVKNFMPGANPYAIYGIYDLKKDKLIGLFNTIFVFDSIDFTKTGDAVVLRSEKLNQTRVFTFNDKKERVLEKYATSISANGQMLAVYDSALPGWRTYDLKNDSKLEGTFLGASSSVAEFSYDGTYITYVRPGNYSVLYTAKSNGDDKKAVFKKTGVTLKDYVFVDNTLFYLANENGQYEWSVFALDPESGEKTEIADNASYGEWMMSLDNRLMFSVIEGKLITPAVYDLESEVLEVLRPFGESEAASIDRTEYDDVNLGAVLLSDKDKSRDLVIWLHGGPKRQTSMIYHSYYGYQVYDEILEKLVEEEKIDVLKLDYTGSIGYGRESTAKLTGNVGVIDVADVLAVTKDLRKEYRNIYLMGNSYGGYLALRTLVEEPDYYDGAISINGVTDWEQLVYDGRISQDFINYFYGLPSSENKKYYDQASIANRVDDLDDQKVLLFVGEKDTSVAPIQTSLIQQILREADKDSEMISFPTEGHTIVERKNLDRVYEEIKDLIDA